MKTTITEIADEVDKRLDENTSTENIIRESFQVLAEKEVSKLQNKLRMFEGKNFTTIGKIELLEEMKDL